MMRTSPTWTTESRCKCVTYRIDVRAIPVVHSVPGLEQDVVGLGVEDDATDDSRPGDGPSDHSHGPVLEEIGASVDQAIGVPCGRVRVGGSEAEPSDLSDTRRGQLSVVPDL